MKIKANYQGPEFPDRSKIARARHDRFVFNFSFLTKDKDYNLSKDSKSVNSKVKVKLLERIEALSQEEKTVVLNLPREQGLERLPEEEVSIRVNAEFRSSGRWEECNHYFWIFRLNKLGRVIGTINDNVFYILAIDTKFDTYKH